MFVSAKPKRLTFYEKVRTIQQLAFSCCQLHFTAFATGQLPQLEFMFESDTLHVAPIRNKCSVFVSKDFCKQEWGDGMGIGGKTGRAKINQSEAKLLWPSVLGLAAF